LSAGSKAVEGLLKSMPAALHTFFLGFFFAEIEIVRQKGQFKAIRSPWMILPISG